MHHYPKTRIEVFTRICVFRGQPRPLFLQKNRSAAPNGFVNTDYILTLIPGPIVELMVIPPIKVPLTVLGLLWTTDW